MIMDCVVITENSDIYEVSKRKEFPVVGCGKWAILPQFCTNSIFAGMHIFFEILHIG